MSYAVSKRLLLLAAIATAAALPPLLAEVSSCVSKRPACIYNAIRDRYCIYLAASPGTKGRPVCSIPFCYIIC